MIPTRIECVGLPNVTPPVAGFRADMIGKQIAPLEIHIKVRIGVTGRTDDGFQLTPATVAKPSAQKLALVSILGLTLL